MTLSFEPRDEDRKLLIGAGRFLDDERRPAEAGTTVALAAVMNAVADAIPEARDIDRPATPERVWRTIHRKT